MTKAYYFGDAEVIDPDTNESISLYLFKHENGGIFAIDASFDDQCANKTIQDPFNDNGILVDISEQHKSLNF